MKKHILPPLPFEFSALEPSISAETLQFHYGKHHQSYVDKLNKLITGTEFEDASLEEIIRKATGPIYNNASQVWNHNFYWQSLTPAQPGAKPVDDLMEAIDRDFGDFSRFQKLFNEAASGIFGSGWAWLVRDEDGRLAIESTSNGDNPIKSGKTAILTCDVWEHAYYIDYRNERAKYLNSIWNIMNWKFAEANFRSRDASEVILKAVS
jgi:superoxide dismutase, Fe-Mn family